MRLDKYLSLLGYTRKVAKALCAAGRVRIGGEAIRDASIHVPEGGAVFLDGESIKAEAHCHLMVHKPEGVLTATTDPRGQMTVLDLIPQGVRRQELGPVGRLDRNVSGLVILTTDGQLAHRLISPKWSIPKRYIAEVEGELTEADVRRMAEGIALKDFTALPAELTILGAGQDESEAELIVTEGKYHQVKRMFGALGHSVLRLRRASIGGIALDPALPSGGWRHLSEAEMAHLYELVSMDQN